MKRRSYLYGSLVPLIGVSGCVSGSGPSDDDAGASTPEQTETSTPSPEPTPSPSPTDTPTATPDWDTGTIVDQELSELREWIVNVQSDQQVTVEVDGVDEGEVLLFQVGDGTGFAHTERFYEDRSGGFTFESDGRHQLQFHPKRSEVPMNEDVTVHVTVTIE